MSIGGQGKGTAKKEVRQCSFKRDEPVCTTSALTSGETLKCSMWNVQSMVHKTDSIMENIKDRESDIVILTETWLTSDSNHVTSLVKTYGYKLLHCRRKNRKKETGGGVGVLVRVGIKRKQMNTKMYSSFEHTLVKIFLKNNKSLAVVCVYRLSYESSVKFFEEFTQMIEVLITAYDSLIIAGDVNIHTETDESYSRQLADILDMFNMVQHIQQPTHNMGHTLDIVATFQEKPRVSNISVNEYIEVSDHFLVDFSVTCSPEVRDLKEIRFRDLNAIDPLSFSSEVLQRWVGVNREQTFGENVCRYSAILEDMMEQQAPEKTKTIKIVPNSPWFDGEYREVRKLRRKAEKTYKKTKLPEDQEALVRLKKQCTDLAYVKKKNHYSEKLKEGNSRTMYSIVNKLLDKKQDKVLPSSNNDKQLANEFVTFFTEKISKLRARFKEIPNQKQPDKNHNIPTLSVFEKTTEAEIHQIVTDYGVKCSPEDPVPVKILKDNLQTFVPIWTELVNYSLEMGSVDCLKSAVILPHIKEMDEIMDKDSHKNYRPLSSLLFLEKLIERVVAVRLNKHMTNNDLHCKEEYGYKEEHSTELLLMNVVNDLLIACDQKKPTIVLLLDLSAAFDTVDQGKLLTILKEELGIDGIALNWLRSFLTGRTQRVKINDSYSDVVNLEFGVAQGSVLGPPLFNIYIRSLYRHIQPSLFKIFGFADDHQLLKTFVPLKQVTAFDDICKCLAMITSWMNEYFLCLNATKTKILVICPPSIRDLIVLRGTVIDNVCIRFVQHAKNLGVILDEVLSFADQVRSVVKSSIGMVKKIAEIKSFVTEEELLTVVCACILSKIDYCNAVYYGITQDLLKKLQSVQNSAMHLIRKRTNQQDIPTSELFRKYHWLPVKKRIVYKMMLIVHKCLLGKAPESLCNMFSLGASARTKKLVEPACCGEMGERSFSVAGAKLWNLLPIDVRVEDDTEEFKTKLKTFLFRELDNPCSKF